MGGIVFLIFVCGICPVCCYRQLEVRGAHQEFSAVAGAGQPAAAYPTTYAVPHNSITNVAYAGAGQPAAAYPTTYAVAVPHNSMTNVAYAEPQPMMPPQTTYAAYAMEPQKF